MMEWFPYLNFAMLAVLLVVAGVAFYLRYHDLQVLRDYDQHLRELLDMLKVLITELRARPCVRQKVEYKTDAKPDGELRRRASDH